MPKNTFNNLSEEKKRAIESALFEEFSRMPFDQTAVKHIVEKIGIPRGSFYQYFESLQESYFYILEKQANGVHTLFFDLLSKHHGNVIAALKDYEKPLIQEIFDHHKCRLYRYRYLNWNLKLEKDWKAYLAKEKVKCHELKKAEIISFIKGIIHTLIERLFEEEWSQELFSKVYRQYIGWIEGGILHDELI